MDLLAFIHIHADTVAHWIGGPWGYFVLFGLLFACGLGLPLPEDIPLLAAGYFIQQQTMNPFVAGVLAWCGIIGGDCMLYMMGRRFGLEITRVPLIGKHVTQERILKAESLFERWGVWVVGVGRMIAGVRGAMVVAAGATRFNFIKFIIADGLGAIVSGGLFILIGYWLGQTLGSVDAIQAKIKGAEYWVYGGIIAAVVLIILYNIWRHRRLKQHRPTPADVALSRAEQMAEHKPPQHP